MTRSVREFVLNMFLWFGGAALGFLLCATAHAQNGTATLSWTVPTQNTDGSTLTDLAGYKLYAGLVQGGPYGDVSITISNPTTTTFVVPGLGEGVTYYFVVTAFNSANPVQESAFSNEASKFIPLLIPNPPGTLTVEDPDLVVYDIVKQKDKYILLAVGEVPAGTNCDPNETVNRHYVVPNDVVIWFGNVRPPVVVADCS